MNWRQLSSHAVELHRKYVLCISMILIPACKLAVRLFIFIYCTIFQLCLERYILAQSCCFFYFLADGCHDAVLTFTSSCPIHKSFVNSELKFDIFFSTRDPLQLLKQNEYPLVCNLMFQLFCPVFNFIIMIIN